MAVLTQPMPVPTKTMAEKGGRGRRGLHLGSLALGLWVGWGAWGGVPGVGG